MFEELGPDHSQAPALKLLAESETWHYRTSWRPYSTQLSHIL